MNNNEDVVDQEDAENLGTLLLTPPWPVLELNNARDRWADAKG
ncbi:uncharacterized protein ARMOST_18242 [Armillaria ostoyae]|uniref:Uncharacterized protein n=1 Tax=Armillaria ostoyae TaxID=47428 RepID=A0A284S198_ARMOS|nr:uncharacterized protein ARMOST_18242 [Armillaria ostoyae]